MRSRTASVFALTLIVLATLSSCRLNFVRRGSKQPKPSPTPIGSPFVYGSDFNIAEETPPIALDEQKPAPAAVAGGLARLEITLRDQNKLNPVGMPMDMSGVISGRFHSDQKGQFNLSSRPGRFKARVPAGCNGPFLIHFGPATEGVLVEDQTLRGAMALNWQHKIAPAFGAYPSKSPNWPVGETITIYYDVIDRCTNDRARDMVFEQRSFRTSDNLEIAAAPAFHTNSNAQAMVQVRCRSAGKAVLVAFDPKNPPDEFNFQEAMLTFGPNETRCT